MPKQLLKGTTYSEAKYQALYACQWWLIRSLLQFPNMKHLTTSFVVGRSFRVQYRKKDETILVHFIVCSLDSRGASSADELTCRCIVGWSHTYKLWREIHQVKIGKEVVFP